MEFVNHLKWTHVLIVNQQLLHKMEFASKQDKSVQFCTLIHVVTDVIMAMENANELA